MGLRGYFIRFTLWYRSITNDLKNISFTKTSEFIVFFNLIFNFHGISYFTVLVLFYLLNTKVLGQKL